MIYVSIKGAKTLEKKLGLTVRGEVQSFYCLVLNIFIHTFNA